MATAIVTGVSRAAGIGATIARRLAADGFELFLTGWSPHDAEQVYGEEPGGGERIAEELGAPFLALDFEDPDAPRQLFAATRADVLVANHARSSQQSLSELTAAELDRSFAVNARATLLLVQAFAAQDPSPDAGRIVLFSSGQYYSAMPTQLPYIASKAVLQQLTASLAFELAPRGITVNCIDPGPNDTGYATDALRRSVEAAMPTGRWGTPTDAARLVAWLCSEEAGWVNGQTIASDGGFSAR
ncbi:SDR family oxidoreductase [Solirubrobacter phytolaccae]|uniref:SDR family oxidoreductase n=1 Tax=Solirubrobacter phytolaccae TaxID=1404360 RepID=A0A9X3S926_9ACTN|nr:SDR family oxidoreductase [Solirubrobacter phytolaccae]MDA0178820.1 SDR family oxidoreductase [Solirubrobacter phytolaccae]